MRNRFDRQLAQLGEELTEMGAKCENAIATAAKALFERDEQMIRDTVAAELEIEGIATVRPAEIIRVITQRKRREKKKNGAST